MPLFQFMGARSPPSRIMSPPAPVIPFCTSPTQLQDVTMDQSVFTYGSLGAGGRPLAKGHSVKEYEEQLSTLSKENFNLKLKIYFLEERMDRIAGCRDIGDALKRNVELSVKNESLTKELQDKHDLLCQAVKALELVEEEHRKQDAQHNAEMEKLQLRVKELEENLQINEEQNRTEDEIQALQNQIEELETEIHQLQTSLAEERDTSMQLKAEVEEAECASVRCQSLETELTEREERIKQLISDLQKTERNLATSNAQLRQLEDQLTSREADLTMRDDNVKQLTQLLSEKQTKIDEQIKFINEIQNMCDKETCQVECLKQSITSRDVAITALEDQLTKSQALNRSLEAKCESITHELKRLQESLRKSNEKTNSPSRRSPSSGGSSTSSNRRNLELDNRLELVGKMQLIKKLEKELFDKDKQINKLQSENNKACQMIQSSLSQIKELQKDNDSARTESKKKEREIQMIRKEVDKMTEEMVKLKATNPNLSRISPHNATFSPGSLIQQETSDKEHSCEGDYEKNDDPFMLEEPPCLCSEQELEMGKQIQDLLQTITEKEAQLEIYKDQLSLKDNRITELQTEVEDLKSELSCVQNSLKTIVNEEKKDGSSEKTSSKTIYELENENKLKDKEIERLEGELRKRTGNLQELVNKELWDKNREIERLQIRMRDLIQQKEYEIAALKHEMIDRNVDHVLQDDMKTPSVFEKLKEEHMYLRKKVVELKEKLRNTPERDNESRIIKNLRSELATCKEQLQIVEKEKQEVVDICTMLTTRLEELAMFLNWLLRQKPVLGLLGSDKQFAIKDAVNKSLDISRTLSVSISMNQDQSLHQLSNISHLLENIKYSGGANTSLFDLFEGSDILKDTELSIIPDGVTVTYNSHLSSVNHMNLSNKSCLLNLEENSAKLNKTSVSEKNSKIEELTPVKSKTVSSIHLSISNINEQQSESEAWSEPDRSVSLARMGLSEKTLSPGSGSSSRPRLSLTKMKALSDSTDDECENSIRSSTKKMSEDRLSTSRRSLFNENKRSITLQEEIYKLQIQLKEKDNEVLSAQCKILDMDNKMKEEKLSITEQLEQLKKEKYDTECMLKESETKVLNIESCKNQLEHQLIKLQTMLLSFVNQKEEYKNESERTEQLKKERDTALEEVKISKTFADECVNNSKEIELQLKEIKDKCLMLQEDVEKEKKKVIEQDAEYNLKIEKLGKEIQDKTKQLEDKELEIRLSFELNWVPKKVFEEKIYELQNAQVELDQVKSKLQEAYNKIQEYEIEITKLQEKEMLHHEKMIMLKKELDSTALAASQAVIERTRISNEKMNLEEDLQKIQRIECDLRCNLEEAEKSKEQYKSLIEKKNEEFTTNISKLQTEVGGLRIRISELEITNAELHNKLVKSRSSHHLWSTMTQTSPNKLLESPVESPPKSGKELIFDYKNSLWERSDGEERINNSSPDLGIESDQGRFSSLETQPSIRPLLQTLELTQSMNDLLETATIGDTSDKSLSTRDAQVNMDLQNLQRENIELKRHLTQTRRALEDTLYRLSKSNELKRQVEKAVCKQIHKTSLALRKAKANLDSGSETEVSKLNYK